MNSRAVTLLLAGVLMSALVSCAGLSPATAVSEPEGREPGPAVEAAEEMPEEDSAAEVAETAAAVAPKDGQARPEPAVVFVLVREERYLPNGVLDEYLEYTYEPDECYLTMSESFLSNGDLRARVEILYDGGVPAARRIFDGEGRHEGTFELVYDSQGRLTLERHVDSRSRQISASEHRYNEKGQRIRWTVLDAADEVLSYSSYTYEDGLLVRVDGYYPDGELADFQELVYDSGRVVRETTYSSSAEKLSESTYSYENGRRIREVHTTDRRSRVTRHEYDETGRRSVTETLGPGGALMSTVRYYYEAREECSRQ